MKSIKPTTKQRGFFDLGLSVLVLALAGGVIYGVENTHEAQLAAQSQQQQEPQPAQVAAPESTGTDVALR
jgi:hypothetical protein